MAAIKRPGLPSPHALHTSDLVDVNEDGGDVSQDDRIPDQDDAQAVLQPAMSAAASHLTSCHTPAIEKAAALDRLRGDPLFDDANGLTDLDGDDGDDGDADGDTTPEQAPSPKPAPLRRIDLSENGHVPPPPLRHASHSGRHRQNLPSPWRAQNQRLLTVGHAKNRNMSKDSLSPIRQRSRSSGQEALKRLQKALPSLPSLASHSHLLPSLPTSFFTFTDSKQSNRNATQPNRPPAAQQHSFLDALNVAGTRPLPPRDGPPRPSSTVPSPPLRRAASDDSLLYNTLSRVSSLGDDDRFMDVREMVSIRLMAFRDSLPDVPNFKMPSLAEIRAASMRRPTISFNSIFSMDATVAAQNSNTVERDSSISSKDDSTILDRVLEELTGDIVVMGGYRGSILRSAEPPHQQLWAPVKIGLNMRKANLEMGLSDEDEETVEQHIIPSGMLKHIGPIEVSRKFFKKLRSCENARTGKLRVWDYGYDWRLSPSRLSKQLQEFLEGLPSNQPRVPVEQRGAMVIAHSLGGLITRHAVNQRPELFAGVLYAGTPLRCVNILGPLRHGDAVLFNDKLLNAQVNFSIRTSFALLPDDGFCFIDKKTGEEYPVDFFDPMSWVRHRLSPCVGLPLPPYNRQQLPSLTSLLPNSLLRSLGDSKSEKRPGLVGHDAGKETAAVSVQNRTAMTPQLNSSAPASSPSVEPERLARNIEYLGRTLASIRQFRAETQHIARHEAANAYPPAAVMYGKSIPTVYAARVNGRDAIGCSDAYDDLEFRSGDGVVLAKEAMLPEGYSTVHGGRVRTERGHITMLGDLPALGRGLKALIRGRRKGIGLGVQNGE